MNSQTTSANTFISHDKQAAVSKNVKQQAKVTSHGSEPTDEQLNAVFGLMGNTFFSFGLQQAGGSVDRVPYLKDALANGVLCEVGSDEVMKKLNKLAYGSEDVSSPDEQAKEKQDAKNGGVDCDKPAPTGTDDQTKGVIYTYNCFCTQNKRFMYCFFSAIMDAIKEHYPLSGRKTCRAEAVNTLKNSGNKMLGELFTEANFGEDKFDKAFGGDVEFFTTDAMKKLLCDAIDPTVENAVRAVYAADGLYWLTETVLYSIIFGEPAESLTEICKSGDFDNEFGKCVCKQDTGYTFCIYKVIAKAFSDAGYLTCGAAPAFVADKKPSALPHLAHKGSSKSSSSATTTFSLLAPAAAAAALLLRQ